MKAITVPPQAKTLNALLKKARRRSLILEAADGERFVLSSIADWEGFDVGDSDRFAVEVKHTAENKKLAKLMAARRERDKGKRTIPLEEVRRELGLKS